MGSRRESARLAVRDHSRAIGELPLKGKAKAEGKREKEKTDQGELENGEIHQEQQASTSPPPDPCSAAPVPNAATLFTSLSAGTSRAGLRSKKETGLRAMRMCSTGI